MGSHTGVKKGGACIGKASGGIQKAKSAGKAAAKLAEDLGAACARQAQEATLNQWITAGIFCMRAMDGSWYEQPLATAWQVAAVGLASASAELVRGKPKITGKRAKKVGLDHLKAAVAGSGVGGVAACLTAAGTFGASFAPAGAKMTNEWVTSWLKSTTQTAIELKTYWYYRNPTYVFDLIASMTTVYSRMKASGANFDRAHKMDFAKLVGIALARAVLAAAIDSGMNAFLKQGHSDRPIKFNGERTNAATDPVREEAENSILYTLTTGVPLISSNGVKSCAESKLKNWPSGHSSLSTLPAWLADNKYLKGVLAFPGALTMLGRVLADCHTPSAVISGMMLAGLSREAADVVTDFLIRKACPGESLDLAAPLLEGDEKRCVVM